MTISRLCAATFSALLVGCNSSSELVSSEIAETEGDIPAITVENHTSVLREIVKIANDETLNAASNSLDPVFVKVENLIDRAIIDGSASGNGLNFVSSTVDSENVEEANFTFSCDSGGTLIAHAFLSEDIGGPRVDNLIAEGACSIDNAAYEGSVFKQIQFARHSLVNTFDNLTVSHANGDSLLLDGDYLDDSAGAQGLSATIGWTQATLHVVENGEMTSVDNYISDRYSLYPNDIPNGTPASASANVNFTVTAPWSNGASLDVAIELVYIDPNDTMSTDTGEYSAQWQSGKIRVAASDGTRFTASPDTGDIDTISVVIDDDTDNTIIHNWADGFQLICAGRFNCQ